MSDFILLIAAVIYFQISWLILNNINDEVPKPYMDEIFHVPQAQEYCLGNYNEWNDKITTLPGLYLLSTSVLRIAELALNTNDILNSLCNAYYLRLSNVFLSTLNFIVVYKIIRHIHSKRLKYTNHSTFLCILSAFSISLFPLNYFFQFLYYTDSGSTFFFLMSYYQQLKSNFKLSALFGSFAILYRQTNVVWLFFCLCQLILLNAENLVKNQDIKLLDKQVREANLINISAISQQPRNKRHSNIFELLVRTPSEGIFNKDFNLKSLPSKLFREDFWGKKLIYSDLIKVLDMSIIQPYFVVITTFLFFVCVNNGIVVGDRSNHQAVFHIPQLFYFWTFTCFFNFSSFLFNLKKIKNLFSFMRANFKLVFTLFLPIILLLIKNFTYEHPFLLADNRHYTFYLWSKLFKRFEIVRYLATIFYVVCGYLFYRNLSLTGKSLGWLTAFTACVFIGVVPQKLIEFRYFIIPFYIYRLNISHFGWKELISELAFYVLVNYLTINLFMNKVFYWQDAPQEPQRFMW